MKNYIKGKFFGETTVEVTDFVCEKLADHMERSVAGSARRLTRRRRGKSS